MQLSERALNSTIALEQGRMPSSAFSKRCSPKFCSVFGFQDFRESDVKHKKELHLHQPMTIKYSRNKSLLFPKNKTLISYASARLPPPPPQWHFSTRKPGAKFLFWTFCLVYMLSSTQDSVLYMNRQKQ